MPNTKETLEQTHIQQMQERARKKWADDPCTKGGTYHPMHPECLDTLIKQALLTAEKRERERCLAEVRKHGKGCDSKYHSECIEMIVEAITNLTKE